MASMVSRSTVLRFLVVPALALPLAGCGVPLSAHWQGLPAKAPSEPGAAAESQDAPGAQEGPDCAEVKCVALTFDDGPGPYTESLLDVLDKHNAKASFFLIGKDVAKYPDIVREELASGHEIGNHTWSHQDLAKLSPAAAERELSKADEAIKKATGTAPTLMRPPYGTITESLTKAQPVPVVMWSDDTLDWKTRNAKKTVKAAEDIKPGSIVLMHDIHKSTIAAVPKILEDLGAQGYHFVTVSQLIGEPKPGVGYKTGQHPPTKD
ncbi:polysaccharide deacetylase family protein [Paeniglutamicibacter psychrophenolicus]|uniref:polysaccharide deacetylase family protein n=1 Tax=Paeniglutamicibacter psychrophenolicus TaxID=257454 RepID=UPI002784052B|nr:polysaccharide deacetylase family protein [Paeniglutamicibacter psychrophenolicus]MDQ0095604.1 peptidoglycan/xylan/chitin deacetylase (PgdA/CDA1 family) [Paeniglutamicibacter psychrophenolicus]